MKITRCLTIATVLLGLTGVSRAVTYHVLDPTGFQPGAPNVTQFGTYIPFGFYDDYNPANNTYNCPGSADGCFDAVNQTGGVITSFSATFTTNTLLPPSDLADIQCPTDSYGGLVSFSVNITCSATASPTNDSFTVTFSGGGVADFSSFWIVENGIPASDFNADAGYFVVGGGAPEPSSLWLALTGLAPIGYALRRRRRAAKA